MYEYYRDRYEENYEQNSGLSARTANRILCITTVVMIGVQYLMVFLEIYDTLPLVLGTQLSVLLIPIIGAVISGADIKETFRIRRVSLKQCFLPF